MRLKTPYKRGDPRFSSRFKRGDEDYEKMRQSTRDFQKTVPNGLPSDIMPILRYVLYKQESGARAAFKKFQDVSDKMFAQAKETWTPGESLVTNFIQQMVSRGARAVNLDAKRFQRKFPFRQGPPLHRRTSQRSRRISGLRSRLREISDRQ